MNPEIQQLKREVDELRQQLKLLTSATTIPLEFDKAFHKRLGIDDLQEKIYNGGDLVSNYVQGVNESGASSYNVLAQPDYILRFKYLHLALAIPAFDV